MPKIAIADPRGGLMEGDEVVPIPEGVGEVPITAMQSKHCRIKFQLDSNMESHEAIMELIVKSFKVMVLLLGGGCGVAIMGLSAIMVLGLTCGGSSEGMASI